MAALLMGAVTALPACALVHPAAPARGLETAATAPPVPAFPVPESPVVRIGLSSDLPEFRMPGRGTPWKLSAPDLPELRGPLVFRPQPAPPLYRVQVGAFSETSAAEAVASRGSEASGLPASVVFSAEKGLYQVRIGEFADANAAAAAAQRLSGKGFETAVTSEASAPPKLSVSGESGEIHPLAATSIDIAPPDADSFVAVSGKAYRGILRISINSRGLLNIVNVVNVEEYLRGVVPSEMGPKRFDEIEALKAQAVAARTYALAGRGGFESEGYDLCATPKCQVYGGVGAEDPLSDLAVSGTRGLVAQSGGHLIHAYFLSTCGGQTEDGPTMFPGSDASYLKSVVCGEADRTLLIGAATRLSPGLTLLEWRGAFLERAVTRRGKKLSRETIWNEGMRWLGVEGKVPPASMAAAAVYPALVSACGLAARGAMFGDLDRSYAAGPPDPAARLPRDSREAFDMMIRWNLGSDAIVPAPGRTLSDLELAGLLVSASVRLAGVSETAARFVGREGGQLVLRSPSGRSIVAADPDLLIGRREGGLYYSSPSLGLAIGDPVRVWKRGDQTLAFSVEFEPGGATYEKESSWTSWVRRVSARELASKLRARVAGTEVRSIEITRRSASGRAVEAKITTDEASLVVSGFDLRQALDLPELLFSMTEVSGASGAKEYVFVGRGWGHGVGLCQNGAYGMALGGATYDLILKHYYTGIDIAPLAP